MRERIDAQIALVCAVLEEGRRIAEALDWPGWAVSSFKTCDGLLRAMGRYDVIVARFPLDDPRAAPSLIRLTVDGAPPVILSTASTDGHSDLLARIRVARLVVTEAEEGEAALRAAIRKVLSEQPFRQAFERIVALTYSDPDIPGVLGKALRDLCRDALRTAWPRSGRFQIPLGQVTQVNHLPTRYGGHRGYFSKHAATAEIHLWSFIRWCAVVRVLLIHRRHGCTWEAAARLFGLTHSALTGRVVRLAGCPPIELAKWKDAEIAAAVLACFQRIGPIA